MVVFDCAKPQTEGENQQDRITEWVVQPHGHKKVEVDLRNM